uniref:Receptor-like serine/threonine-protein kinase n=1 Tax=Chenopodium quinoa TaxID=63459 RepID=A0A803KLZ8_CHEQI
MAAQRSSTITIDESLSATINDSPWLSPSGDFAFGFHQLPNNSSLFLLAIWYAKIPDTIVWYANDGNPVQEGSKVTLTADKGLVLSDAQGNNLIWSTNGNAVSHGFMNDTGNLALKNRSSDPVWQSFNHPTDTLLPNQFMEINGEVNSRLSETNFTQGRFQLRLIPDGNLVLNTRDLASGYSYGAYYVTGTNGQPNTGQKLVYNESGYMYILRKDGSTYDLLQQNKTKPARDYYQRETLNFDGVLMWYYIPKTSLSNGWSMIQASPDNVCTSIGESGPQLGSGICGFNSICILGDDKRPACKCPPGYSFLDFNNTYGSCEPDFQADKCEGYAERSIKGEYRLERLPSTNWPFSDYEKLGPYNEDDCKNSCLSDCFCAAVVFQDNNTPICWKKKAPLSYGRQDTKVQETTWIKVGNVKFSNDPLNPFVPLPPKAKKQVYHNKPLKACEEGQRKTLREFSNVHCFSYQELTEATMGFMEELGRGAFGVVYKGMIATVGPPICVAVKKLDRISDDADKEFRTEVNGISQTHHKNLVRLVGFCKEGDQRLLVYEYMSNGTLADYLFGDLRPSWVARIQIALGIARGLLYLHEECSTQIIHCDIKPQNILLDDNLNARIADFGLAKLLVLNQTHTNTAIRGTKGYVAPEWFRNKPITVKVDVYSFGVLLLEIISCRRSVCMELIQEEGAILTDWAFDCYQSNTLDSLANGDMEALDDWQRLKRFLMVALWCIQEDPSLRPTMRTVMNMLEGLADVPKPPFPTMLSITTAKY